MPAVTMAARDPGIQLRPEDFSHTSAALFHSAAGLVEEAASASGSTSAAAAVRETPSSRPPIQQQASGSASDSGSVHSVSLLPPREFNTSNLFARRSSILPMRRPRSAGSTQTGEAGVDTASVQTYEMTTVRARGRGAGKPHVSRPLNVGDHRVEPTKDDEAVAKWRKWIVERPAEPSQISVISAPEPIYSMNPSMNPYSVTPPINHDPPKLNVEHFATMGVAPIPPHEYSPTATPPTGSPTLYSDVHRLIGPNTSILQPTEDSVVQHSPEDDTISGLIPQAGSSPLPARLSVTRRFSDPGHHVTPPPFLGPRQPINVGPSAHSILQDIYTTESVRVLRDVELAVDPDYYADGLVLPRTRRLSTHPRLSDMDNPFINIDTLISRRGIRPLVLELVHALGAFIDAVWTTAVPDRPCPWAGVPVPAPARRASIMARGSSSHLTWRSWVITAVQEGKRRNFLNDPPTEKDVKFWCKEIQYGLRDVDEAVNRRKDLGWAFGEAVVRGQYGDIVPANVFALDGGGGNIPRLLNDLEEALWGDAMPAPTDLVYEVDSDFDPFSVYREGDEIIGIEGRKPGHDYGGSRDAELKKVFDGFLPASHVSQDSTASEVSGTAALAPRSNLSDITPSFSYPVRRSSVSEGIPLSPTKASQARSSFPSAMDISAFGVLQAMSMEEKLELGRRRHQEYLERTRAESGSSL